MQYCSWDNVHVCKLVKKYNISLGNQMKNKKFSFVMRVVRVHFLSPLQVLTRKALRGLTTFKQVNEKYGQQIEACEEWATRAQWLWARPPRQRTQELLLNKYSTEDRGRATPVHNVTALGFGLEFTQLFMQQGYANAHQNFLTPLALFLFQMHPNV
jgi:hypothetical protein